MLARLNRGHPRPNFANDPGAIMTENRREDALAVEANKSIGIVSPMPVATISTSILLSQGSSRSTSAISKGFGYCSASFSSGGSGT